MKSGIGRFRKEKGMEKKSREIRAAPPAPCSKKTDDRNRIVWQTGNIHTTARNNGRNTS